MTSSDTVKSPSRYDNFGHQFIGGEWREGRSASTVIDLDPYSGKTLLEMRGASVADVDDAYTAAVAAQPAWAALLPRERADLLLCAARAFEERHDEIVDWLIHEAGATNYWAQMISRHAVVCCSEAAAYAQGAAGLILPSLIPGQQSYVHRKPVGVVALATSWNSPINLTMRALAPALALGNAVVLKPASDTPVSGGLIHARVFEDIGLPKGLFSVLVGASAEIGSALTGHDAANSIAFTGSTRVGREIMAQNAENRNIKRLGLELGGNSPVVVLDDADLDLAANAIVFGRFLHQGQVCMSTNRVLADASIHDALVDKLRARISELPFGDPSDPRTVVGPLMSERAARGVLAKIERAKAQGARMLVGGPAQGNVVPPHLFVDVRPEHELSRDEI
ncbi:aldehyde dehydrogenase family protein, partial [Pseudomonas sp. CrR25]|nr:aldehyde dehydrogenase family protein [Pseudomonas sp. CrR25]